MSDHAERLQTFLAKSGAASIYSRLTPDASTREYFRIEWCGRSAVACVYGESFQEAGHSYVDVTNLFLDAGLPVAEIFAVDDELAVIVLEDLGDRILRRELDRMPPLEADALLNDAIRLIVRIQAATSRAFETASIASRRRFDKEKLFWELTFFKQHYFQTYRNIELEEETDRKISAEFDELASDLAARASVLCHRDFHAANLMIDPRGRLRMIDHQDAMIGSVAYDLVSLLLDRVTEIPTNAALRSKIVRFLSEREDLGFDSIDENEFVNEFWLQAVQRCLKAVGTFSYQSAVRGKKYFVPFIRPQLETVVRATEELERLPAIKTAVERELRA